MKFISLSEKILSQKIKNLSFTSTALFRCPNYIIFIFSSDLSRFGYKFRFPTHTALRFCIWYEGGFFLLVHSYSRDSKGRLVVDSLSSYYNHINKELTLKELINRVLPSIFDIEKINA